MSRLYVSSHRDRHAYPRPLQDPAMRRLKHGPIQPMQVWPERRPAKALRLIARLLSLSKHRRAPR